MTQENFNFENTLIGNILVDSQSEYSGIKYGIITKITKNHVFMEWHTTWDSTNNWKHSIKVLKSWLEIYRVICDENEKSEFLKQQGECNDQRIRSIARL